jgi:hypothetical protein
MSWVLNTVRNRIVDGKIERRVEPDLRARLRARLNVLADALDQRDAQQIELIVTGLLATFPAARSGIDDADVTVTGYTSVLADLPPWAVRDAARKWARGEVPGQGRTFAPSSAELYHAALAEMAPLQRERQEISEVLNAPVAEHRPTPEEIATVAAGFRALTARLHAIEDERTAAERARRRAIFERSRRVMFERECRAAGLPATSKVSPSLARLLQSQMAEMDVGAQIGDAAE